MWGGHAPLRVKRAYSTNFEHGMGPWLKTCCTQACNSQKGFAGQKESEIQLLDSFLQQSISMVAIRLSMEFFSRNVFFFNLSVDRLNMWDGGTQSRLGEAQYSLEQHE